MKKLLIVISVALFILTACSSVATREVKKETVEGTSQSQAINSVQKDLEKKSINDVSASFNPAAPESYQEYLKKLKDAEETVNNETDKTLTGTDADLAKEKSNASFWDKELNGIYKLLIEKLPEAQVDTLRQEERQWIKKRDEMADDGNSNVSVMYYSTFAEETKQRTLELIQIYYGAQYNEYDKETYTIKQGKDNAIYIVTVLKNYDNHDNFLLQLFDAESNELQSIRLGQNNGPIQIDFKDVNLDGFTDIIVNTGGTINESHNLYLWGSNPPKLTPVVFKGFDMLSHFEVHQGYIMNWAKDSGDEVFVQKLVWDGNTLILKSEEKVNLNN